jgi:hypothetical protein
VLTSDAPSVLYIFKRNAADGSFALSSQQTMASKYLNYTTLGLTFSPDNAGCYYNSNAIGWYTRDVTTGVLSGQAEYKNTYDLSKSDHSMADVCLDSATRGLYTLECASTSVQTRLFVLRAGAFAAVEQSNEASSAIDGISAQPNPFNPATRIFYSLNKSGRVKLELFNVAGTRILTFVNERQAAGRHSAILDARALPSGVYVCRLNAGSRTVSRRIMLVR